MVQGLNPLAISRFTDNPNFNGPSKWTRPMGIEPTPPGLNPGVLSQLNYGVIRKDSWASGVIERRHSLPGIEPGALGVSPKTLGPP